MEDVPTPDLRGEVREAVRRIDLTVLEAANQLASEKPQAPERETDRAVPTR